MVKCLYKNCDNYFEIKSNKKFCSRKCKEKNKDLNKIERLYNFLENKISYRAYKKTSCAFCGFIPVNMCQLDVDHIDGNHENNNPENLQTLCANCHRLKTFLNKDYKK